MKNKAVVVGAGFAGCEAAMQLSKAGIETHLYEMKPKRFSPAHGNENFCELVCSNSFKAERLETAAGLLKEEMSRFDSVCVRCAKQCRVPAGGSLAVDRDSFSLAVTKELSERENIIVHREEVLSLDFDDAQAVIAAPGPLASEALSKSLRELCGTEELYFYDAAAPIVSGDSIDMQKAFFQSRYGRGGEEDYINCPMTKEEYEAFFEALLTAEAAKLHDFDKRGELYEGCMPIELMARRGKDTMRFGPLKPVGLRDPRTGERPYACLQLRRETSKGELFNLVGFQTNLKFSEQKRVFSMIPALREAEFQRYGVMHRNTYINSPRLLNADYSMKKEPKIFFAGQITGVEGYMESAMSGILAGINAARRIRGKESLILPKSVMMGALSAYISSGDGENFQPMGANFGILEPLGERIKDKNERRAALARRSLSVLEELISEERGEAK